MPVLEIGFEGIQCSTRDKSAISLRFPSVERIGWDHLAVEAARLTTLKTLPEAHKRAEVAV